MTTVRRFEAAGFRAWPAGSTHYDGAWAIRLTPGHKGKRLNSINPLDPRDFADIQARLERASWRFAVADRPLTMRISPLVAWAISEHLDGLAWSRIAESTVMRLSLSEASVDDALDQIPLKDVGRFVDALGAVRGYGSAEKSALSGVIGAIEPEAGLFVLETGGRPIATAICVPDSDLAGIFEVATAEGAQGKGHGRRIVLSALKWARLRGAHTAWLQVELENYGARRLYDSIGFQELYRYHYRQPPGGSA
nr:GNAT family N-acetyltransferase [Pseudaminobacter soli]